MVSRTGIGNSIPSDVTGTRGSPTTRNGNTSTLDGSVFVGGYTQRDTTGSTAIEDGVVASEIDKNLYRFGRSPTLDPVGAWSPTQRDGIPIEHDLYPEPTEPIGYLSLATDTGIVRAPVYNRQDAVSEEWDIMEAWTEYPTGVVRLRNLGDVKNDGLRTFAGDEIKAIEASIERMLLNYIVHSYTVPAGEKEMVEGFLSVDGTLSIEGSVSIQ